MEYVATKTLSQPITLFPAAAPETDEQTASWPAAAELGRRLARNFASESRYAWQPLVASLARKLSGLARSRKADAARVGVVVQLAEQVALELAQDTTAYCNYAINPEGLHELVEYVTSLQAMVRELARRDAPGALGAAMDAVWSESPNSIYRRSVVGAARDQRRLDWITGRLAHLEAALTIADEPTSAALRHEIASLQAEGRTLPQYAEAAVDAFEQALAQEIEADHRHEDTDQLADARCEAADRLADVQASTQRTAAAQLAVALHYGELIRGCLNQEDRDHFQERQEQLIKSALHVMVSDISPEVWTSYVGGEHPHAATH